MDLEAECVAVERDGGAVALAHVEGDEARIVVRDHGLLRLLHELVRQSEAAVRPQHRDRRDVPAGLGARLLLPVRQLPPRLRSSHLGQNVANNTSAGVDGDVGQLRPRQGVVQVWKSASGASIKLTVLERVVLRKVKQVGILHAEEVLDLSCQLEEGGEAHSRLPDVHVVAVVVRWTFDVVPVFLDHVLISIELRLTLIPDHVE